MPVHSIEQKFTEYSIYLSAMRYTRENPQNTNVDAKKTAQLLNLGYENMISFFSQARASGVLSYSDDLSKNNIVYSADKSNPDFVSKCSDSVLEKLLSDPNKMNLIGKILVGENNAENFISFKTDKDVTDINKRVDLKSQKTAQTLKDNPKIKLHRDN